ncbi:MAG: branched-chain amino acid transport system II carrier protein [Chlamydiia bacterium]|nr:branched-chain amino acid transport system II carrier protein [Chlamydiia bacterium]
MEFCQSQRSRFDPIEAAPIQMDRSDAEGVKDGDADTGKNQVLSFLGYNSKLFKTAFYGSMIGAILLGAIYTGFSLLAAFHGGALESVEKGELLARITLNILGPQGGLLVCLTITLVCLTTAIALISSFADFIRNEVFQNKLGYEMVLASSLLLTFFVSIFDFSAISSFLEPILEICYPGLILLTGLNLAYRLKNFRPVKLPVYMVFSLSLLFHFLR